MPGIEGDGLGPVQWTPGEIEEPQVSQNQSEAPKDSIAQAQTGQQTLDVQLLLQKPNLSILEFAALMAEMYAEIQELANETDYYDRKAMNRFNHNTMRQAARLVLHSALHGVQSAFSENQASTIDSKIGLTNASIISTNTQLQRMNERDQEEHEALQSAISEYNVAVEGLSEEQRKPHEEKLNQAINQYNAYVSSRNSLLESLTNQANATAISYNMARMDYNSSVEGMNESLKKSDVGSLPQLPMANQSLEPIASLGEPMASFSISMGPNGVKMPEVPSQTTQINQTLSHIYANNVSQSIESQLMGSISSGLNLVRTLNRVVDAIESEIGLSNRLLLDFIPFASRSFLQRMPDLFLNFGSTGMNFGLASLAFGVSPVVLQVAIAQSLLLEIMINTKIPVPTLFFEQIQAAMLKLVAQNALLSVVGALSILGKGVGNLNAESRALDVALTLSLSQRLKTLDLSELTFGSAPLQAALRLTLSAHLLNRLSLSLGLSGLGVQVLALATGLSSQALTAQVAVDHLISSTLLNPFSQATLISGLSNLFSQTRGRELGGVQSLVNDVINLVSGNYGTKSPAEIAYQLHLAFQERGENLLDSIFLTNAAMEYVFGDVGMNRLDVPLNSLFNREEVIRLIINTGVLVDVVQAEDLLASAIAVSLDKTEEGSLRELRDALFLELYLTQVMGHKEAMYIANQVANYIFSGEIAPLTGIIPERLEALVNLLGLAGLSRNIIQELIRQTQTLGIFSTEEQFFVRLNEVIERDHPDINPQVLALAVAELNAGTSDPLTHVGNNGSLDPQELAAKLYEQVVNRLTYELSAPEAQRIANSVVVMVLGSVAQEGAAQGLLQQMQNDLRTLDDVGNPQLEGMYAKALMDIFTSRSQYSLFNQLFQEPSALLETYVKNFGNNQDQVRIVGGA